MQVNPKNIKKQFEKSMDKYDENAFVQRIMAEKLVEVLREYKKTCQDDNTESINEFQTILELGAGTGILTRELVQKLRFKNYYANDLSEKSEQYIKNIFDDQFTIHDSQFTFLKGNALKIKPPRKVSLIAANAVFQWLENLEKAAEYFSMMLESDGIIAFTTFTPQNFKEIRDLTGLSLDYKTPEQIRRALKGYKILHMEEFEHTLTFQNPLELLAHMKHTGVNSLSQNWSFADVKDFCDRYTQKYPQITLTYAPVIVIAQKDS